MRAIRAILVLAAMSGGAAMADTKRTVLDWSDLHGWDFDDHASALTAFHETCGDLDGDWAAVCALSKDQGNAKAFFETFFLPVLIEDGEAPLFTGYYEPELQGSPTRTDRFRYPLYRKPDDLRPGTQWYSRAEIEERRVLHGRGLEIAWLDDPVDAFFLQIQGSGRIAFPDGTGIRVGYAARNGHEYRSVGREMIRRGLLPAHSASAAGIKDWVRANPAEGRQILHHNPSFIFFREVSEVPAHAGPLGAMNRSITPLRSVAVDPDHIPLGAPVWVEKNGKGPLRRLMIAQDTGAAIKGAQRADIFYGTGKVAGNRAGRVRDGGRIVTLLPIEMALAPAGG